MHTHDITLDLAASQLPSDLLSLDLELLADQAAPAWSTFSSAGSLSTWAGSTAPSTGSSLSSASSASSAAA